MTADEHFKLIAGDLLAQIAIHKAQLDTLNAETLARFARIAELEAEVTRLTEVTASLSRPDTLHRVS